MRNIFQDAAHFTYMSNSIKQRDSATQTYDYFFKKNN